MTGQSDITDILGEMANGPISCESKIKRLLRRFAARSIPLSVCADKQHLQREVATLRRYACEMELIFPDYTPWHMQLNKDGSARVRRRTVIA